MALNLYNYVTPATAAPAVVKIIRDHNGTSGINFEASGKKDNRLLAATVGLKLVSGVYMPVTRETIIAQMVDYVQSAHNKIKRQITNRVGAEVFRGHKFEGIYGFIGDLFNDIPTAPIEELFAYLLAGQIAIPDLPVIYGKYMEVTINCRATVRNTRYYEERYRKNPKNKDNQYMPVFHNTIGIHHWVYIALKDDNGRTTSTHGFQVGDYIEVDVVADKEEQEACDGLQ